MDFGQRIVLVVPGGFDKHGGDDVLIRRVAPVVIDQLISPYRGKIAERLNRACGGAKPRMPVHAGIPKMAMCADDRSAGTLPPCRKLRGSGEVPMAAASVIVGARLPSTVALFGPVMQRLLWRPCSRAVCDRLDRTPSEAAPSIAPSRRQRRGGR
jgi:hypothetical protein